MLSKASVNVSSESQKRKKTKIMSRNFEVRNSVECDDEEEDFNEAEE